MIHSELIVEWSKKNLPLTPDGITFGSNKVVWWKGSCGHEWQTSVKARSKGEKCPICSGARAVAGINDLSTLKPGLASEWSKKNEIKPTEVTVGSHKKVIWKCRLGHEWTASVKSRSINGSGCPYCSHNKVLVGFNDLATVVPKVADEWSEKNEKKPTEVTAFANRKAWWKCRDCKLWDAGEKGLTLSAFEWEKDRKTLIYGQVDYMYGEALYKPEMKEGNPIRLYSLDEITEIFCKLGLRICNSFADFSGKPSSDNDIQLMVYSIRE